MVRSPNVFALLLIANFAVVVGSTAAAQPRQPRPRVADESDPATTTTTTTTTPTTVTPIPEAATTPVVEPSGSANTTVVDSATASGAEPGDANPRIKQHDFGFGYRGVFFATAGTRYVIHGPTVAYTYFVGRRWGFMLHGEASFPFVGHMNGDAGTYSQSLTTQYDQRRYAFDGLFMAARRFELSPSLVLTTAVGLHVQSFELKSVAYLPVEAITGGVGGLARIEWLASDLVSVGGCLMTGIDPIDFVRHADRVVITMPFSATVSLGLRY